MRVDAKDLWQTFAATGAVSAYLSYKAAAQTETRKEGVGKHGDREHDRDRGQRGEGGGL